MSSKRRSYDTDEITLRKVFAKSALDNANIGGMKVLTADGAGGTYWAVPSTLGFNPAFNQINTTAGNFTADLSYNIFTLSAQSGIGFSEGPGSNELYVYGKAFNQIDVSGNNTVYGFTDGVVTPAVKFAATGGLAIRSNPQNNTIFFDMEGIQVSTSLYSFQKVQVYSNASTLTDSIASTNNIILNAASPSTILGLVGVNDIRLFTDATSNLVYFDLKQSTGSISTLTGLYSNISTGIPTYITSTVRGLGTAGYISSLSTFNLSTQNLFTSTITFKDINTPSSQILAVSSGVLVLNGLGIVGGAGGSGSGDVTSNNLVSTVVGLGTAGYVSTSQLVSTVRDLGLAGYISSAQLISTVRNLGLAGYVSSAQIISTVAGLGESGYISSGQLISSVAGLGEAGYISSAQLISTVQNLGLAGYLSSTQLISTVRDLGLAGYISSAQIISTVAGLGEAGYISSGQLISSVAGLGEAGYISSAQLISTVRDLGLAGYVSSSQMASTVRGLGQAGYLSTFSSLVMSTGTLFGATSEISSVTFKDTSDGNKYGLVSSNASLYFNGSLVGAGSVINNFITSTYVYQVSSVSTIYANATTISISTATNAYLSPEYVSSQFFSTGNLVVSSVSFVDTTTNAIQQLAVNNGILQLNLTPFVTTPNLASTVQNLGLAGYISSAQLISTVQNLGLAGYISSAQLNNSLASTVRDLGLASYVSSSQMTSTIRGLGEAGYISSAQLISTVRDLGLAGYISSAQLISTVQNLGLAGYISSAQLISTVQNLGLAGYISSAQLISTVQNLGLAGYISSAQLISTVGGLGEAGYISSAQLISTVQNLGLAGYISSAQLDNSFASTVRNLGLAGYISSPQLISTVQNLGLAGYISSAQLISTVQNLGLAGYISSAQLISTVQNLGLAGYISSAQLISTVRDLGLAGYISSAQLISTVGGLGAAGYLSSFSTFTISTQTIFTSTVTFRDINEDSNQILAVSSGILTLNGLGITGGGGGGGSGDVTAAQLISTTAGLQSNYIGFEGFFSSLLVSTMLVNMTSATAPAWNSNFPIAGGDPEPNPLAVDIFGSVRILKNLYIGSTTTVIGTSGIWASTLSTTVTTARRLNFSSLFVNNAPIIVDSNGNLLATSQIF